MQLAIDDFGTGYSMMQQLRRVPATEIKVDKGFVQAMLREESARVVVEKTIELGHELGMRVVAEGVETAAQLSFLRDAGCDLAQGYLVLKIDLNDLYAPIRDRLGYFVLILLLATVAGGWVLRWRVRPLARRLAHSEVRLRMALENSKLAVWDWDIPSGRVNLSEQWSALLGGVPQVVQSSFVELAGLVHPEDAAAVAEQVRSMLKGTISHYSIEHRVRTHAGEWKWIRSRGRVVERARNGSALRAVGTNVDIDYRKPQELELAHRATHDVLSNLPDRGMFHDRLDRAMLRTRRSKSLMVVMYLDVDKFKGVNDTLGHAAGDTLLKEFSRRLTACVRSTDTMARFGGDEFAVILEGLGGRDDGLRVAGNIVAAMRTAFALEGHSASVSTSVDIAFHDGAAESGAEVLLKAADEALYAAKAAGRDRYCVARRSARRGVG